MSEQYKKFDVAATFDVPAPPGLAIEGFADPDHPAIPVRNDHYVFRREVLNSALAFLVNAEGDGLYLTGPTGCGKTSGILQICARLNWPAQEVTAHGRMELSDLIGQFQLVNGSTEFVHGPLAQAVKEGHVLVLNEIDLADPSELAGLNDIVEGAPLVIAANGGEVIRPHPKFRLVATGNSAGSGDTSGLYQGVLRQNLAFLDRFRIIEVGYPDEAVERSILSKVAGQIPEAIRDRMVKVAGEIRRLFVGGDTGNDLTVTMSTRGLERWARLALRFKGAPNAFDFALRQALTNRAPEHEREAIHRIAKDIFGEAWKEAS